MTQPSKYVAKQPDTKGFITYTAEENAVWAELITRQKKIVAEYACQAYLTGLATLNLPAERIPQCAEMNNVLQATTGWSVYPVPALIPDDYFFQLLAERKFPAATFIRRREELKYLQEPDIFHEFFGHCPMLTDPVYADFMQLYGKVALQANADDRHLLARLYWFTVEFGLINTRDGLRCYGGGILSSMQETVYAITDPRPQRRPFAGGAEALRTPYRIDQLQTIYYVIDNFSELYNLFNNNISKHLKQAHQAGDFPAAFEA